MAPGFSQRPPGCPQRSVTALSRLPLLRQHGSPVNCLTVLTIRSPSTNTRTGPWPLPLCGMSLRGRRSGSASGRLPTHGLWFDRNPLKTLPLYRLPQIADADKIIVVEGEKCVHAVLSAWPNMAVTTFAGGSGSHSKTDWTPLAGKDVSIWADADDDAPPNKPKAKSRPGQAAAMEIAAHLFKLGCHVRVALPEPDGGADIADWLAVGKANARAVLDGLLRDYKSKPEVPPPASPEEPEAEPKDEPAYRDKIANNKYFRLLGLEGSNPVFRLKAASQILTVNRKEIFTPNQLRSISGGYEAFWSGLKGGEELNNRRASEFGSMLLEAADRLPQMDWSKVYGRGAVRLDGGRIVYHLGDRLLEDGKDDGSLDDDTVVWTSDSRIELSPDDATDEQCKTIAEAVMRYRWRNPIDGKRFLGWMVSAIVGGALEWRPHIQLTAPSGRGKSWLLREVLSVLMGPLLTQIVDASPAALARLTGHSSLPFSFDEAEPSAMWIKELLLSMRAASGGEGLRVRVNMQTGGVDTQRPRFSALLSNVSSPDMSPADASRMVVISLGDEVEDWAAVEKAIPLAMASASGTRSRIIRDTKTIVEKVKVVSRSLQVSGMDSREALASGALTVGWQWWGIDDKAVYSTDLDQDRDRTDATDCLTSIMEIILHTPGGMGMTLAKALTSEAETVADLYGVRYNRIEGLVVAYGHSGLKGGLRGTRWEKANLKPTLLQLEGATLTNPLRLGRGRPRCVLIPHATLIEARIEIGEETK